MTKIYLGKLKSDVGTYADSQNIYLDKHSWDCGWYWGFGYIGNKNCHFHFESLLKDSKLASELFKSTNISDNEWWVIRDLFKQAYVLKEAAAVYRYGGHQTSRIGVTDMLRDDVLVVRLNADLKKILDVLWDFVENATKTK